MATPRSPLLLLHPAATLNAVWRPLARIWEATWPVLAPNLLPSSEPATQIRRWADDAAAQIVAAGGPAHVLGASLGASVALRLAQDYPALVASLTLDSAQLGGPPPPLALRRLGQAAGLIARHLPARLVAAALLSQFPAYQGEDREAVRADILRLGVPGIIGHLRAQLAHDVRGEASDINVSALLFAGERDLLTRSGAHEALQRVIPHARLVVVPGAGHVTFLCRPGAIVRELRVFLSPPR